MPTVDPSSPAGRLAGDVVDFPRHSPRRFGWTRPERLASVENANELETNMKPRIEYADAAPDGLSAMRGLETYVRGSGLETSLVELVKVRASQINGCAYCLDMHTKDARATGEKEQRLYAVAAWHETPFFSERERAALAWTEALTLIGETQVPDEVYEQARRSFGEKELVDLTLAVVAINGWNRLSIAFRTVPGSYRPELSR